MSDLLTVRGLDVDVPDRQGRGRTAVLHDVDLDLPRGRVTCVVGESGSGKTLLMRSLLGIAGSGVRITGGQARVRLDAAGPERELLRPGRRGLLVRPPEPGWAGYVFQHPRPALDPMRTVGRQIADSLLAAGEGDDPAAIRARLEAVHLEPDAAGRHPHELSGGMAQRVAIAVALARNPRLLVADEPTTGLDWSLRREVVELLASLCRERGLTLLLISHDFQVVRHLADRVVVLLDGRVREVGPREVFFDPGPGLHPYTAELQAHARALATGARAPESAPGDGFERTGRGCSYAPRCLRLRAVPTLSEPCRGTTPALRAVGPDHRVRCHAVADGEGT